jgi:hypothetical protein
MAKHSEREHYTKQPVLSPYQLPVTRLLKEVSVAEFCGLNFRSKQKELFFIPPEDKMLSKHLGP